MTYDTVSCVWGEQNSDNTEAMWEKNLTAPKGIKRVSSSQAH